MFPYFSNRFLLCKAGKGRAIRTEAVQPRMELMMHRHVLSFKRTRVIRWPRLDLKRPRLRWRGVLTLIGVGVVTTTVLAAGLNVSNTAADSLNPAIAIAPDGTIYLVWEEDNGYLHSSIYAGGAWSNASSLGVLGDSPALAVDANGTVHLAWVDFDSITVPNNFEIRYMKKPSNGSWTPPQNVSDTSGTSSAPDIAVAADGTVSIVWTDNTPGSPTIFYSDLSSGGSIPGASGTAPQIAVDANGTPHVVWQDTSVPSSVLYARRTAAGWSLPEDLTGAHTQDATTPQIAVVGDVVHVVWLENGQVRAVYGRSQSWSAPQTISGSDTNVQEVALAADGKGNLHVVWVDGTRLRYARRPAGGGWEQPITLLNTANALGFPALSGDANYTAHLAWAAAAGTWDVFYDAKVVATLLGDLNEDCRVDVRDIMLEAAQLGNALPDPAYNFDGDNTVGSGDVAAVAARWRLNCPGP